MRCAVFIDGGNFYSKLKDLKIKHTSKFDFQNFIKSITGGIAPSFVGYYVGQVRKEKGNLKSEMLYANQQKLFVHLQKNMPGVNIIRGHIQNHNGVYKEKGVDVRLALDIYKLGTENSYDRAILLSSDSDLLPAVKMVQQKGKEVEYIGFSHLPSIALLKECKAKRLLSERDVKPFEAKDLFA